MGGSPGLVVTGDDSCSRGRGFESRRRILDGYFSHWFFVKIVVCLKRPKINEKGGLRWPFLSKNRSERSENPASWEAHVLRLVPRTSLDKGESLGCQIAFPFNKKKGCFYKAIFLILFLKTTSLLLNGEVIWQPSDSPLSKDVHACTYNARAKKMFERGGLYLTWRIAYTL